VAVSVLESLECGLDQIKKSVLEKVIPVWSAKLEAIRIAMLAGMALA